MRAGRLHGEWVGHWGENLVASAPVLKFQSFKVSKFQSFKVGHGTTRRVPINKIKIRLSAPNIEQRHVNRKMWHGDSGAGRTERGEPVSFVSPSPRLPVSPVSPLHYYCTPPPVRPGFNVLRYRCTRDRSWLGGARCFSGCCVARFTDNKRAASAAIPGPHRPARRDGTLSTHPTSPPLLSTV